MRPKFVRRALMVLGALAVVLMALSVWVGVNSVRFRKRERPFVIAFAQDLSRRWQFNDVYARLDHQIILQSNTDAGRRSLARFSRLGALRSVNDFEMNNFLFDPDNGSLGVFSFKGTFDHGAALVRVTLSERRGVTRVLGLDISRISLLQGSGRLRT
jgi:hypothetical protein